MHGTQPRVEIIERRTLYRDPYAYCAHPHLAVTANGEWVAVFNRAPRRGVILHPSHDPEYRNVLTRSDDEGRTWSAPAVAPDYDWSGVECAGITALRDGRLLLNQWRFEWLPLPAAERSHRTDVTMPAALFAERDASRELERVTPGAGGGPAHAFPWARGGGQTVAHVSDDCGRTFVASRRIDTSPFTGGYGMRGAVELANGAILLPFSDVPNYRQIFVVRSTDHGETWSAAKLAASAPGHEFEEPAIYLTRAGRIAMLLRDNGSRVMHFVASDDGGTSWTEPRSTGIMDYPAHVLTLPDGRMACVAGRRRPPFAIVMYLSADGESWDQRPIALVDDLPSNDLGYPTAAVRADGDIVVLYYAQDRDGVTGIHALTARMK